MADGIGTVNDAVENTSQLIKQSGSDAVSQGLVSKTEDASLATVTKTKNSATATLRSYAGQAASALIAGDDDSDAGSAYNSMRKNSWKGTKSAIGGAKAARRTIKYGIKTKSIKQTLNATRSELRSAAKKGAKAKGKEALAAGASALIGADSDEVGASSYEASRKISWKAAKIGAKSSARTAKKAKGLAGLINKRAKGLTKSSKLMKSLAAAQRSLATQAAAASGARALVMKIAAAAVAAIASILPILMIIVAVVAVIIAIIAIISSVLSIFSASSTSTSGAFSKLTSYEQPVAKFLKSKGLDNTHIAALIGTWRHESGCDPQKCQHGTWSAGGLVYQYEPGNDQCEDYPAALVDDGSFGYGIAQWTSPGRARGLVNMASERNVHSSDFDCQMDYFWEEFTGSYEGAYNAFMAADNTDDCVEIFATQYEINAGGHADRQQSAREVYDLITSDASDVVSAAESQLGSYYYWAAEGETHNGHVTFDCSGFVKWCYDTAGLEGLAHYTVTIYDQVELISEEDAQPGDICGWGIGGDCYHVGIYVGDGKCIDACGPTNWTEVPSDYITTYHDVHYYSGTLWFGRYGG